MNEELQNAVWAVLPAEFRNKIRNRYVIHLKEGLNIRVDELKRIFGEVNLTSAPEQSEPKFKVGDEVQCTGQANHDYNVYKVVKVYTNDNGEIRYDIQGLIKQIGMEESDIKPYRKVSHEPCTSPTDKAEEKELDLRQILKGYENNKVYSPCFGTISMVKGNNRLYPNSIAFSLNHTSGLVYFKSNGLEYHSFEDGVCSIFPNKELYKQYPLDPHKAWAIWSEQQKPKRWVPSVGDRFYFVDAYCEVDNKQWNNPYKPDTWDCGNCFKTPEDAEYAAQEMRKCLERVHNELNNENA